MRMMGMGSVGYHEHTVAGRGDDPVAGALELLRVPQVDPHALGGPGPARGWAWTASRPGRVARCLRHRRGAPPGQR